MAFETLSYTSLLDELERDQIDFDLPAWSTKESPGHESVDSGTGGSVIGDASPIQLQEDLELNYDPNLNDDAFSSILEELESVDLTVMQKPCTRSSRQDVPRPMTPILPQLNMLKDRDACVTNLLDIALDVADHRSLRGEASRDGSSAGSLSCSDQSDFESDGASKISVRSLGGKSFSFVDKNKLDFSNAKILSVVRRPMGSRNIKTGDIRQLSSSKPVEVVASKNDVPNKHLKNFMKEISPELTETVQQIEKANIVTRNKQAINARLQRKKRKEHVARLEKENEQLKKENAEIQKKFSVWEAEKLAYEDEIAYLKSVLANQSALSSLIKNIEGIETVNLSSSFSRKRQAAMDHDYTDRPAKKGKKIGPNSSAGVCLHVANKNKVSLEFCSKCAKDAL